MVRMLNQWLNLIGLAFHWWENEKSKEEEQENEKLEKKKRKSAEQNKKLKIPIWKIRKSLSNLTC